MTQAQPASWVIIRRSDNVVISETFDSAKAEFINLHSQYHKAVPIMEYLTTLNAEIKENDKRSKI